MMFSFGKMSPRPPVDRKTIWLLRGLVVLGGVALTYYYSWWTSSGRITSPWFAATLIAAILYTCFQVVGSWFLYLSAQPYSRPAPTPNHLTVDIFVTVCAEPYGLVRRALVAARAMRGEHKTWLLDDGSDPLLALLAASLGAGYLSRSDRKDAKAGNINAAAVRTRGDIIVIFDVDHAPMPDFLECTLGYFANPRMGFVQVMPTFYNGRETWVARAAAESSLDFYNPISLGMHRIGSATMMGSNALIRREALASIGGYQPGLAEDLATSLALHAAGWQSAYVAEPLAPGLAPHNLQAWFTQQLKWARGVFEVLLLQFPRLLPHLTWGQRLAYGVRMTYYLIGPVIAIHILAASIVLLSRNRSAQEDFQEYLLALAPLLLLILLIRHVALRSSRHPSVVVSLLWRAIVLIYATWPVYTLASLMTILRVPFGFRPTPKEASHPLKPGWLLPHLAAVFWPGSAVLYSVLVGGRNMPVTLVLIVGCLSAPQVLLVGHWLRSRVASNSLISDPTPAVSPPTGLSKARLPLRGLPDNKAKYE